MQYSSGRPVNPYHDTSFYRYYMPTLAGDASLVTCNEAQIMSRLYHLLTTQLCNLNGSAEIEGSDVISSATALTVTLFTLHPPSSADFNCDMSDHWQPFRAESERQDGFTHILLITTGSVASIKAPLIVSELLSAS